MDSEKSISLHGFATIFEDMEILYSSVHHYRMPLFMCFAGRERYTSNQNERVKK